jgi:hypothetical protein
VYINDLPNATTVGQMRLFADDANHFIINKNCAELKVIAEQQIKNITKWMNANQLTINYEKTNFTIFKPCRTSLVQNIESISVNNHNIPRVNKVKYLGIFFDDGLTWKEHIKYVFDKVRKYSGIFYKMRHIIPGNCLKQLYFALVHSTLQYGIEIYANTNHSYLHDLIILNNRILRTLQFRNARTRVSDLYSRYNTLPVNLLHDQRLGLFVYKFIYCQNLLPPSFHDYFRQNSVVHSHLTRSRSNLHVEMFNKSFGKRALHYRAMVVWNNLPTTVKTAPTLANCKILLYRHLLLLL